MASHNILYMLPTDLVSAIRKADVLTGEFLRPVAAEALAQLEVIGLASSTEGGLTDRGMEIRCWLMSGTERAPHEVSRLLAEVRAALSSGPGAIYDDSRPLEMTATPSLLPIPREIEPRRPAAMSSSLRRPAGGSGVGHH